MIIEIPAGPERVYVSVFEPVKWSDIPQISPSYGVFFPAQPDLEVFENRGRMSARCKSPPPVGYFTTKKWSQINLEYDKLVMQNLPRDDIFRGKTLRLEVEPFQARGLNLLRLKKVWVYL